DAVYSETGLYEVLFTVPEDFRVAMSGTLINAINEGEGDRVKYDLCPPSGEGLRTCHYVSGPMRDSLVVAGPGFGVITACAGDEYRVLSDGEACDEDDVAVNVYFWRDDDDVARDVLRFATDSVRIFNEKFGPYPFNELDVVETFNFTGIEYPGIVVIAERNWQRGNAFLEITTAHEVAHQWWYSLVGNDQVLQPWLDESITSYSEYVYLRNAYDERRAGEYIDSEDQAYRRYRNQNFPDLVLDLPVSAYDRSYGAIIYTKGPLFYYQELEQTLGRDEFFDAVQLYFQRHRYEVVRSRDVLEAFEDATGQDLDYIFAQKVGEFPGLDRAEGCRGELRPEFGPIPTTMSRRAVRWLYGTACGSGRMMPQGQPEF
ncbi:MAG: M1 family metallopeptidase, partial [Chloroflexi bacterium]|nr:M1 family metallopeptidase [Chloroflexota bacterium]